MTESFDPKTTLGQPTRKSLAEGAEFDVEQTTLLGEPGQKRIDEGADFPDDATEPAATQRAPSPTGRPRPGLPKQVLLVAGLVVIAAAAGFVGSLPNGATPKPDNGGGTSIVKPDDNKGNVPPKPKPPSIDVGKPESTAQVITSNDVALKEQHREKLKQQIAELKGKSSLNEDEQKTLYQLLRHQMLFEDLPAFKPESAVPAPPPKVNQQGAADLGNETHADTNVMTMRQWLAWMVLTHADVSPLDWTPPSNVKNDAELDMKWRAWQDAMQNGTNLEQVDSLIRAANTCAESASELNRTSTFLEAALRLLDTAAIDPELYKRLSLQAWEVAVRAQGQHGVLIGLARSDAGSAKNIADSAKAKADKAETDAGVAKTKAETADTNATNAKTDADKAQTVADGAQAGVNRLVTLAQKQLLAQRQDLAGRLERVRPDLVDPSDDTKASLGQAAQTLDELDAVLKALPQDPEKWQTAVSDIDAKLRSRESQIAEWERAAIKPTATSPAVLDLVRMQLVGLQRRLTDRAAAVHATTRNDDMKAEVEAAQARLASIGKRLDPPSDTISSELLAQLADELQQSDQQIARWERSLQSQDLADLGARIDKLIVDKTGLTTDLFQRFLRAEIDGDKGLLKALKGFGDFAAKFNGLEKIVTAMDSRLNLAAGEAQRAVTTADAAQKSVGFLGKRIDSSETSINDLTSATKSLRTDSNSLGNRVAKLEKNQGGSGGGAVPVPSVIEWLQQNGYPRLPPRSTAPETINGVIQISPESSTDCFNRGYHAYFSTEAGADQIAAHELSRACQGQPSDPIYRYYYGLALRKCGRVDEAVEQVRYGAQLELQQASSGYHRRMERVVFEPRWWVDRIRHQVAPRLQ